MRAWFSVPIVKGIRTGISVNPNSFRSSDPLQFVSRARVENFGASSPR
jgi:hypothetical protein